MKIFHTYPAIASSKLYEFIHSVARFLNAILRSFEAVLKIEHFARPNFAILHVPISWTAAPVTSN